MTSDDSGPGRIVQQARASARGVGAMLTMGRMHHPVRGFLNGAAAVAAVAGLVALLVANPAELSLRLALAVYAGSLVAMFTVSSLYH